MNILITGANRGIGLELVRQTLARGDQVVAAARDPHTPALQALSLQHPQHLRCVALDVTKDAQLPALLAAVRAPLDVLINNAGVKDPPAGLVDLDLALAAHLYEVNALGPLRVTRALLPRLIGGQSRVVHISSQLASIGDNHQGGFFGYRMAKAALNMASRCLAHELGAQGIISVALSPGWVQTDMGGSAAPLRVEDSVRGVLRVIDGLTPADNGAFLHHDGARLPW